LPQQITTIDAHVGGQPLRLVVGGAPRPGGATVAQKRDWLADRADHVRRSVVLEPRGHADMTAALLTETPSPGAHAGLVFMDAGGYPTMSAHGVIGAVTIAIERGLLFSRDVDAGLMPITLDTPAGAVHAMARVEVRGAVHRVDRVAFANVPAFVHTPAQPIALGQRRLRVDIAFGGIFYAIVDTEAAGIPLEARRLADLRRLGNDICDALNGSLRIAHPADPSVAGVGGVIFTGPPADPEAHLRNVTVTAGVVDRSAGGNGTSAVMAVLDAMGLLPDDQHFVHEGLLGSLLRGRILRRTIVGDTPAIVTEIEATAWITGEHTFFLADDDPFREGIGF
jgi:trans-L-3-hydroxyproline dehydratase